ncbi:hypothetical protein ACF0H5_001910 [Mactra antiquata]
MHGWDRIASACGIGCKVFWTPWAQEDKYNTVSKDDNENIEEDEPVTTEPIKPVWSNISTSAPIVRNKSVSLGNIRSTPGYERLSVGNLNVSHSSSSTRLNEKRNSKTELNGSVTHLNKSLLRISKDNISGSRASIAEEKLHVSELVTTV